MKKAMTRLSLIAASALSMAVVGMGGAASAGTITVSTQGPNSGVHISVGGQSWGNDWQDNEGHSQCNGNQNDWTTKKKNNCNKKGFKQSCIKVWSSCWSKVKNCF